MTRLHAVNALPLTLNIGTLSPSRQPGTAIISTIPAAPRPRNLEILVRALLAATQHQALCALLFLYRRAFGTEPGDLSDFAKSRHKARLAVVLSRAVLLARLKAGITKPARCHPLRHSFATHLQEDSNDIPAMPELLGHAGVSTTVNYTRVSTRGGRGVLSRPGGLRSG